MSDSLFTNMYNPDVLSCLANLSNDEVFTPPDIANQMLDLLPQELFSDPNTKFLDPACKSGVFLREIAKRLIIGLEPIIPELQKRIDHIFKNQLYGIAITELTSLLSRRGVYCSKYPNSKYSVTQFSDAEGNIRYKRIAHKWKNGRCVYCGASQQEYDRDLSLETHAYELIHTNNPEEIFNMKFDVIIGNPPYQLNVGIEKEDYAIPIYQKFIEQCKKLSPRYLSMIIPARWYSGGRGLDEFRNVMLNDNRISKLHDFPISADCFPGVQIKGGVCYFLWDFFKKNKDCIIYTHENGDIVSQNTRPLLEKGLDVFIRQNDAIDIYHKVISKTEKTFDELVSAQTPFGIITSFKDYTPEKTSTNSVEFYTNKNRGFISSKHITKNISLVNKYKILISKAYGAGEGYPHQIINRPFTIGKNSCCSQTYLAIGPFESNEISENVSSYMKTKFFRFMVMLLKNSQDNMRSVFKAVPIVDFSKPWTDEELYAKYGLTEEEIDFIESMIKPME